jgi:hypothetical protein
MNFIKDGYPLFKVVNKANDKSKIVYMSDNVENKDYFLFYKCTGDEEIEILHNNTMNREVCSYLARSGAGKSYQAKIYAKNWKKNNKGKKIILFSPFQEDKSLDDLGKNLKRVRLGPEFVNKPVSANMFADSLVIFDDIDTIGNKAVRDKVNMVANQCLLMGRHRNISVLVTSHKFCCSETKITINESHKLTIYPSCGIAKSLGYLLENYRGFTPKQVSHLKKNHGRWVTIETGKYTVVICDRKAYILNVIDEEEELKI